MIHQVPGCSFKDLEHWRIQNFLQRMGAKGAGSNAASGQYGAKHQKSLRR